MDKHTKELGEKLLKAIENTNDLLGSQPGENAKETYTPENTTKSEGAAAIRTYISPRRKPSPQAQDKPESTFDKAIKRWKPRLELVAIFFAIGYAIVTYWQWQDATSHFKASERAWVGLDMADKGEPIVNGPANQWSTSIIHIKNYGMSPALHVLVHGRIEFLMPANPDWIAIQQEMESLPLSGENFTLFNGQSLPHFTRGSQNTAEMYQAAESGEAIIISEERVTYKDILGGAHETTFCLQYVPHTTHDAAEPTFGKWKGCEVNEKAN